MILRSRGHTFIIEDKYAGYSPYLSLIEDTEVGVDVDEDGAILIDYHEPLLLEQYLKFLEGEDFFMTEEVALVFQFMGHRNDMEYPIDFWKIKLQDNWIRDNFYGLKLGETDPYYGLVKIPKQQDTPTYNLLPDVYIAGGAALFMAGESIDCSGVIYDGQDLWATKRAMYSIENKVNWFDPDRMSPSYVYRLCKYMRRGYEIRVPLSHEVKINQEGLDELTNMVDYGLRRPVEPIPIDEATSISRMIHINKAYETGILLNDYKIKLSKQDILLMALWYGIHPISTKKEKSDYDPITGNTEHDAGSVDNIINSEWNTIDPMTQLTGTFHSSPILGGRELVSWLRESSIAE